MAISSDDRDEGQSGASFLAALLASQKRAIESVSAGAEPIARAAEAIAARLQTGGRLIYLGAGSSALIALQDGAELPGTFGLPRERIVFLVAGGLSKIADIDSAAEDDIAGAGADVAGLGPLERDIVLAVSASGSTPYTLARAKAARERGAILVALANRPSSPLLHIADHPILLDSGPEALHGSTRLAAGTAQKCALGLISTLAHARLGHVYRGHMVNVRAENDKLRKRAVHIVASIASVDEDAAGVSLSRAKGDVKAAILIAAGAGSRESAQALIDEAGGHIGPALTRIQRGAA
jgi:N-acetylmuramic acid 6-phosphate etherase